MKRKLLALAIPMLLITGVGCESKDKKKDEVMEASIKQNKKEDYNKNASYLLKEFMEQTEEIDDSLDSWKSMDKKAVKLKELKKPYFELIEKIENLDYALKEDTQLQKDVGRAMFTAKTGIDMIEIGLKDEDKEAVNTSRKDLESASKSADKIVKELDKKK
ncbi:hypothetical protein P4493_05550 [Bacillus thuringiensis]|uniref:Tungsten formylmethanofuran dehydrogenase n=4 Tax=Bacillus cereus group TaxID=86661 RepID=A0A0B5NC98_BACTU|nr:MULTISPECIES: hypothetical protein [Bacillus]MEC2534085.1 hypothetical protein [Bacillus cereus]MED1153538.1 hypothetical protein [Bacillus paranthracis]OUB09169.1 hypothetical protein BK708_32035 [Bacillus thuringiensis serovar yunnanensis]AFQ29866.1 hypothetical protein BTF1_28827 [Bacillus thuringiensis HD-789]AJG74015.1 hypothetical protein BF38_5653 [Bacillus thuringiensis]